MRIVAISSLPNPETTAKWPELPQASVSAGFEPGITPESGFDSDRASELRDTPTVAPSTMPPRSQTATVTARSANGPPATSGFPARKMPSREPTRGSSSTGHAALSRNAAGSLKSANSPSSRAVPATA